jgi:hypothetical protein
VIEEGLSYHRKLRVVDCDEELSQFWLSTKGVVSFQIVEM